MSYEFKNDCRTCEFFDRCRLDEEPCSTCIRSCGEESGWKPNGWFKRWLNSFDISSATKCFEAVNKLKEAIGNDR